MIRLTTITIGLSLTLLLARDAAAQWNVARFETEPNRVYTTFGLDPAMIGAVGYARVFGVAAHPVQLTTEIGVVTTGAEVHDFRGRLGLQSSLIQWRSLHLTGSATFVTRGTENSIYRAFSFGSDVSGTVGTYHRRWFAAGEGGFDKSIITHVTHTDWYRDHVFPDAKDAWYLDTGGTFHYGLAGGLVMGRTEVVGRGGWLKTERYNALTPSMYASLGVGLRY
jgi:hypothetical protein